MVGPKTPRQNLVVVFDTNVIGVVVVVVVCRAVVVVCCDVALEKLRKNSHFTLACSLSKPTFSNHVVPHEYTRVACDLSNTSNWFYPQDVPARVNTFGLFHRRLEEKSCHLPGNYGTHCVCVFFSEQKHVASKPAKKC